jgi:hypothetical protein
MASLLHHGLLLLLAATAAAPLPAGWAEAAARGDLLPRTPGGAATAPLDPRLAPSIGNGFLPPNSGFRSTLAPNVQGLDHRSAYTGISL